MHRRIRHLTPEHVDALAEAGSPWASCVTWQVDVVRRHALGFSPDSAPARVAAKRAWVREVLEQWGHCGQVVLVGERPVAVLAYAPPVHVPGVEAFPTAPASADAVVLAGLWVAPEQRGAGLARALVQAAARDLLERGDARALEAFAATGGCDPHDLTPCSPPEALLARLGFETRRAHPRHARMRLDLRSTAPTHLRDVGAAVERLWGALRPSPSRPSAYPAPDARVPATQRVTGTRDLRG